jgi:hypothetical protein
MKLKTHLYKSIIRPILLYEVPAWGYAATINTKELKFIQNEIIRRIYDGDIYASNTSIRIALGIKSLNEETERALQSYISPSGNTTTRSQQHWEITTSTYTALTPDENRYYITGDQGVTH